MEKEKSYALLLFGAVFTPLISGGLSAELNRFFNFPSDTSIFLIFFVALSFSIGFACVFFIQGLSPITKFFVVAIYAIANPFVTIWTAIMVTCFHGDCF